MISHWLGCCCRGRDRKGKPAGTLKWYPCSLLVGYGSLGSGRVWKLPLLASQLHSKWSPFINFHILPPLFFFLTQTRQKCMHRSKVIQSRCLYSIKSFSDAGPSHLIALPFSKMLFVGLSKLGHRHIHVSPLRKEKEWWKTRPVFYGRDSKDPWLELSLHSWPYLTAGEAPKCSLEKPRVQLMP